MSRKIVIDRYSPELPPVCVATGATDNVQHYQLKFQFTPFWARFFFGAIGMLLFSKKTEIMVPFTPEAHAKYKRSQWMPAVIIIGGVVLGAMFMALGSSMALVGGLAMVAAIVGGLIYALVVTKSAGPMCKHMDDATLTLEIPSDLAADAIETGRMPAGGSSAGVAPPSASASRHLL